MPNYVFYDIQGIIYKKKHSISSHLIEEGLIEGHERTLQVDENIYRTLTRFKKVSNGQVVDMTQSEIDAILAQDEADRVAREIADIDDLKVIIKDVIVALVKRINVRIPSNPLTKEEIVDQIKTDRGL